MHLCCNYKSRTDKPLVTNRSVVNNNYPPWCMMLSAIYSYNLAYRINTITAFLWEHRRQVVSIVLLTTITITESRYLFTPAPAARQGSGTQPRTSFVSLGLNPIVKWNANQLWPKLRGARARGRLANIFNSLSTDHTYDNWSTDRDSSFNCCLIAMCARILNHYWFDQLHHSENKCAMSLLL